VMAVITIEVPPQEFNDAEREYLVRQLVKINTALMQSNYFPPRYTLPAKSKPGEVVYFAAAILPDITGEGLWLYKTTGWAQLG